MSKEEREAVDAICQRLVRTQREGQELSQMLSMVCVICVAKNGPCPFEEEYDREHK